MAVKLYRIAWQRYSAHIRTADAALVAQLGRFLDLKPGIEETEPPGAVENLITIEESDGAYRIATSDWQLRAGNRGQLLFAALEAVGQIFVYEFSGAIFHAGAFLRGNSATLFFGAPQSGKSTLGFSAWRRGLPLIGDDRVVLMDEGRRVRPFPKCVKLRLPVGGARPRGCETLPPEAMVEADLGTEIRLILARSMAGFCAYDTVADVDVVVELKRGADCETTLEDLAPGDALDAALKNVVSPDFDPMGVVRLIKRQAEGNRLLRLTVGPGCTEQALDLLLAL